MNTRMLTAALFSLPLAGMNCAEAHHAFAANYEMDDVGTVEGIVEEVVWANPHVHYYIQVTREDGTTELWDGGGREPQLAGCAGLGPEYDSCRRCDPRHRRAGPRRHSQDTDAAGGQGGRQPACSTACDRIGTKCSRDCSAAPATDY